jgi:hypothetical protein
MAGVNGLCASRDDCSNVLTDAFALLMNSAREDLCCPFFLTPPGSTSICQLLLT